MMSLDLGTRNISLTSWIPRTARAVILPCLTLALVICLAISANAQTLVSGEVTGTVTDTQGAAVANATVVLQNQASGATLKVTTNAEGKFTAPLLKPGVYILTATGQGLTTNKTSVEVPVGAIATADLKMKPAGAAATVEVSAATVPIIDLTTPALVTTFDEQQFQELPAPGGDISTIAYTAPGVVVNAGGAYGNFSADGLPGISNLFVLNGADYNDPFLSLNNSGSSNLTLGQAEVQESSVIVNSYSSQYGRAAGATVSYITKSGGNNFHGLVNYYWNGDMLNANDWFRNLNGANRERSVSNQWAVQGGGPIIKDKLFFFTDYEGLHYVLPVSGVSVFPSAALQTFVLNNIPSQSTSLYTQTFNLYKNAPFYNAALSKPTTNAPIVGGNPAPQTTLQDGNEDLGCGLYGFSGAHTGLAPHQYFGSVPSTDPSGSAIACTNAVQASASNLNQEFLWTWRADWHISDKHSLFGRSKMDHGTQPTFTDFTAPIFNTVSKQPEYEGQLNDTYLINDHMTNQFVFSALWYTAYFGPSNLTSTLAAYPTFLAMFDAGPSESGFGTLGMPNAFPQGRNVTGYQFEDDLSRVKGNNTFKVGVNLRRDLISLYDAQANVDGGLAVMDLPDFSVATFPADGISSYSESFTGESDVHIATYNLGVYAQDDFSVSKKLKVSAGLRVDRTGNPSCKEGCFAEYTNNITPQLPSFNPSSGYIFNPGSYSSLAGGGPITQGNNHVFPAVDVMNFQPRGGVVYDVFGNGKTVVSAGAGLFTDLYPSVILDNFIQNFPNKYNASVISGVYANHGVGNNFGQATAQNTAVQSGFKTGGNVYSIANVLSGQGAIFPAPSFGGIAPHQFHNASYIEWSAKIQQQITPSDAINIGYVGNKGYNELFFNADMNASSAYFNQSGNVGYDWTKSCLDSGLNYVYCYPGGVNFLPKLGADPNFSSMSAITNSGYSNYNGLQLQYKHRDRKGLTIDANYTWSHSMDLISNGGAGGSEPFNIGAISGAMTPYAPYTLNYSNADYDTRNSFSLDAVWDLPYKFQNPAAKVVLQGWTVSAKSYYKSGEPFSATDTGEEASLGPSVGGTPAAQLVTPYKVNCSYSPEKIVHNGCLNFNNYALDPVTLSTSQAYYLNGYTPTEDTNVPMNSLGNVRRNSYYGPHYADSDIMVEKHFSLMYHMKFALGATAFNAFNHPNFGQPSGSMNAGAGGFGYISNAISPPTSPYGSFQGAAVTGRLVQVFGKFSF